MHLRGMKDKASQQITISLEEYNAFLKMQQDYQLLKDECNELKRLIFGSKRERYISEAPANQLSLFNADKPQQEAQTPEKEKITYTRDKQPSQKKGKARRVELPGHLPRKEEVVIPKNLPEGSRKIGEVRTELLDMAPAQVWVKVYVRGKYVTPDEAEEKETGAQQPRQQQPQTKEKEGEKVKIAPMPTLPLPRSNAAPGMLAYLHVSKYVDHLPIYRITQMLKRQQVEIAPSTINNWMRDTVKLLQPLYDKLKEQVQRSSYLMADETPIPVQKTGKPGGTSKGYHWVYYSPPDKLVCFDYGQGRSRQQPQAFLENFQGSLQTDGYGAYERFGQKPGITLLACMAHARRKFEHALGQAPQYSDYVLGQMQKLYAIERTAREEGYSHQQRYNLRQEQAVPVLDELEKWLEEKKDEVLPKSTLGKAVHYTINQWQKLRRYIESGRYEIDNNLVENSIRPVTLGRKNYLFAGSHEGARWAAMMYSFFGTCKINNVEPYHWLKRVLEIIPDYPANKLDELLPGKLSQ